MGRKIDMKKIEDITRCQVTFSKRRSSLMKKANEIAVCCDVDVAFVAFSPSGRISKFCNQRRILIAFECDGFHRIEDVLHRYVNLPVEKRLNHISNVQGKMEKLRQLGHIKGDTSKLQYLEKQIENLELQIKKSGLELQILETGLRDYELGPEQEPSLHQLSWCERNLKHSLQRIIAKKDAMVDNLSTSYQQQSFEGYDQMGEKKLESQAGNPFSSNFNQNEQISKIENPSAGQILMQLDPWISPYSARARENILQDLLDHATNKNISEPSDVCSFPIPSNILNSSPVFIPKMSTPNTRISSFHVPQEKFLVVDHSLLNFHDQNNVNARNNNFEVGFSDRIHHMSTQSLCNIQGPRFTSTTTITTKASCPKMAPQSIHHDHDVEMETGSQSQCTNSNLSQLSNLQDLEAGQQSTAHHLNMVNSNEDYYNINSDVDTHAAATDQPLLSQHHQNVFPHNELVCQNTLFDDLLPAEDTIEDNTIWTAKIQKSGLWEWEDLLLDVQDFF